MKRSSVQSPLLKFFSSIAVGIASALLAQTSIAQTPNPALRAFPDNAKSQSAREALRPIMEGGPNTPMPENRATLDAALAKNDQSIFNLLMQQKDVAQVSLDLNWERSRIFEGAGYGVSLAYMYDLWRLATFIDNRGQRAETSPESIKQTAVAFALYNVALLIVDGVRCADPTAPNYNLTNLLQGAQPILAYGRVLSAERQQQAVLIAQQVEQATAPLRRNDPLICDGGVDQFIQALAAGKARTSVAVPAQPGEVGAARVLPDTPTGRERFRDLEVWQPEQQKLREGLAARLGQILVSPPANTVPGTVQVEFAKNSESFQRRFELSICKSDIKAKCSDVEPERINVCLNEHLNELSEPCRLFELRATKFLAVCAEEVKRYCSNAQPAGDRVRACLSERLQDLDQPCQQEINPGYAIRPQTPRLTTGADSRQ
jgi:hypothetical protein